MKLPPPPPDPDTSHIVTVEGRTGVFRRHKGKSRVDRESWRHRSPSPSQRAIKAAQQLFAPKGPKL